MTTLLTKEPLTIQDIINRLAENPKKTDFKNTEIMRYAYFNNKLAPTLEFENVTFENATFTTDFLYKVYFNRCTFKKCRTTGSMPMPYGSYMRNNLPLEEVQVEEWGGTFENCIFDNFKWELHQPMKNFFRNCQIINNSDFSNMILIYGEISGCQIKNSFFSPMLCFRQYGDVPEAISFLKNNIIINSDLSGIDLEDAEFNEFINCRIENVGIGEKIKNNVFSDICSCKLNSFDEESANLFINVSFEYSDFTVTDLSKSIFKNCDFTSPTNHFLNTKMPEVYKSEIRLTDDQLKHITFV